MPLPKKTVSFGSTEFATTCNDLDNGSLKRNAEFKVIHSVHSGNPFLLSNSSVRSGDGFCSSKRSEFDSVRSYQHEFEMDVENGDIDDDDDEDDSDIEYSVDDHDDDETELTSSPNSKGYNGNNKAKGGDDDDDDHQAVLAFFYRRWKSMLFLFTMLCLVLLMGWTYFTAEYEVIKKPKKHNKSPPHQYEYQKEEIHSCEKDGCGLSAQANDRHQNAVTHVLKNNTYEVEQYDHCGWGDTTQYMAGDSANHFTARKNAGKGCTYCKNKDKCVYKHPANAVCLSDSQCMSNKCNKEQLCAQQKP